MYFIDEINLVSSHRRSVASVVQNLAHVVDAGIRRRVELEQIDEAAGIDVDTRRTDSARRRRDALHAIEALRKDARDRRLANAPRPCEQIRVMQPSALERVGQRLHDVLLARELCEGLRPPFPGERLITHDATLFICLLP